MPKGQNCPSSSRSGRHPAQAELQSTSQKAANGSRGRGGGPRGRGGVVGHQELRHHPQHQTVQRHQNSGDRYYPGMVVPFDP